MRYLGARGKGGGCRRGQLVAIGRPGGDAAYIWSLSRGYEGVMSAMEGFKGLLQADAYAVYIKFANGRHHVVLAGCWAHARRKFTDIKALFPAEATRMLRLIGLLYLRERQWKEKGLGAADRAAKRQLKMKSTLALIRRTAERMRREALPASGLGKALDYLLREWDRLGVFIDHGELELDNNLVENLMRPPALGRKNWLFIGHPEAGDRCAILYTLIACCHRHGANPAEYMRWVLGRITQTNDYASLTPEAYARLLDTEKERNLPAA